MHEVYSPGKRKVRCLTRTCAALMASASPLLFSAPAYSADATIDGVTETVDGGGGGTLSSPLAISGTIFVSTTADATFDIVNGGTVNSGAGMVGTAGVSGPIGAVTVTGSGSTWTNTADLNVGYNSTGVLTLADGGKLSDVVGYVGYNPGSTGAVTVTGAGSTWANSDQIGIGASGTGILTIADGGVASSGGTTIIAFNPGSTGTLNIGAAEGDTAVAPGMLETTAVGLGFGTAKIVFNHTSDSYSFAPGISGVSGSGEIDQVAGTTTLTGDSSGFSGTTKVLGGTLGVTGQLGGFASEVSDGGMAGISGHGANWTMTDRLTVANTGNGKIVVYDGGTLADAYSIIGVNAGSGGEVIIAGEGSSWTNTGYATIGANTQAVLTVGEGATFTARSSVIGLNAGSQGFVQVGGDGSSWTTVRDTTVADRGRAGLSLLDGATGSVDRLIIAANDIAAGGVFVDGDGSTLTSVGDIYVGYSGNGTLTLSNGGEASTATSLTLAVTSTAQGTLNIGAAAGDAAGAPGTLDASTVEFGDGTGRLVFNHTSNGYSFAPDVSGAGEIDQMAGATKLTGDSSGFSGTTNVSGGTLDVNGTLGGVLNVLSGGTLKGSGTVGAVTIAGTVSPGNSPGALHVASATFNPGSTYLVELNDGGNAAGVNNDLIDASGTVTINGGTAVHVTPENGTDDGSTYTPGTVYTIVTAAGGVSGTFDTLTDDYAFLDFALSYDANDVTLTSSLGAFCREDFSRNECATADAVGTLGSGTLLTTVSGLGTAEAAGALDQLSGEIHASAKTTLIDDSRFSREAIKDRLRQAFGGVDAGGKGIDEKPVSETASVWAQGFGSWGHWNGDGNAARLDRSIGGLFIGGDASVTDSLRLGIMGGYSHSSFDVDDRSSSGSARNYTIGAYGAGQLNALGLRFGTTYSWHDLSTSRSVAFTGFSDNLSADYDARTFQAFGEAGYRCDYGKAQFEPYAGLAYVHLRTDGFTETGGAAALTAAGQIVDATFSTLGLRAGTDVALSDALQAHVSGGIGWRHAYGDVTPEATLAFASGSDAYTIAGVPIAKDALVLDAGFDVPLAANAKLGLAYDGQVGSGILDQSVKANLAVRF